MSLWNTVEFTHVALGLVPKVLNPVDVIFLVCKEFRVVDPEVFEVRHIQEKHLVHDFGYGTTWRIDSPYETSDVIPAPTNVSK